ncbi:MAG: hypothetical protein M1820_004819 [Bogoriella megaspora]|nr:MAG: hypothetical protein M1820_004819 [Bogoriella megaspora]
MPATPFSDPLLPQLELPNNPYYRQKHHNLRRFVREYVDTELLPFAQQWEEAGQVPEQARKRHCELGFSVVHPIIDASDTGGVKLPAGIPYEEWDTWCGFIVADETSRLGWCGVTWGLGSGNGIGCPPISRFGHPWQRERWLPQVAKGNIRFCLGITEPDAGSDVANIQTTAVKEGQFYKVNGSKKWITNGIWADFCTTAVRTGGPGHGGISLLVIPLKVTGVTTRRMHNTGVYASGSTFITFEDVKVPIDNLIGEENEGFRLIMSNFNPERLALATAALRLSRVAAQDAYNYACIRETFGKRLIAHHGIRSKVATFGLLIEPVHAFLEQLIYIIEQSRISGKEVNIGGQTALLKVMATRCLEKCVREAQQIMGGAGYSKSGHGARIEAISRDVRVHVVGGGSEEIMLDLAVRQESRDVRTRRDISKL